MNFNLSRGTYLTGTRAQKIIDGAGRILRDIGIKIVDKDSFESLKDISGITLKENRAYISCQTYESFLNRLKEMPEITEKHGKKLHGEASLYTYHYRDIASGKIRDFTVESLTHHAQLMEKAKSFYPLNPVIPGYPTDVPAELSSLIRYKLSAENCSSHWPLAPDSVVAADYMYEMAAVMEEDITCLPIYMISPLTLGGDAFEIVKKNKHRLKSFYTFSMPNMGVTTPMNISMGLAMVLAEVAGGTILVEHLTGLRGDIKPNLFPFDFKYFNIAFGSPEKFLYEQLSSELVAYIKDQQPDYSSTNIHTWAKQADGRSAMEKGMMIMAGALWGAKRFYCIGTLSLDELFDPLQMIQDLESISFAQQMLDGSPVDDVDDSLLDEIAEGLESGFVISDRSLDEFDTYLKSSMFSPKDSLQKWIADGQKSSTEELRSIYHQINSLPAAYRLEKDKKKELDKIYQSALGMIS